MAEESRLIASLIDAFVDRMPIEWQELRSKTKAVAEQPIVENVYLLDAIRGVSAPAHEHRRHSWSAYTFVLPVVTLAGIQTVACLLVLGVAYAHGDGPFNRSPQIAVAFGFSAASLLIAPGVSRDPRILSLLAWFVLVASTFARHALTGVPAAFAQSIDAIVRGVTPEAFMPACLWQFASDFPRVTRFATFDTIARRAAALAWLLGVVLFIGNVAAAYQLLTVNSVGFVLRGHPSQVYWHLVTLGTLPAVAAIFYRSRRAPVPERRRVARLAWSIAAGTGPFLLLSAILALFPQVYRWAVTATPAERLWIDIVVIGGLVATPILATLAVIVDRPFELQILPRAATVYAFSRVLLNVLTLAPFVALAATMYRQRHGSLAQIFSGATGLLPLGYAVVGCALLAVRARLVGLLDRRLSHRSVEHHQQLSQTLDRIRLARGVREVAVVLSRELRRGTGASAVSVLSAQSAGDFVDESQRMELLTGDSGLVAIMKEAGAPLDVSDDGEVQSLLPLQDRNWLATNNIALLAPLKHRDDEIAAVVAVGPKRRRVPFDQRDLWLIGTLTTAAAATWSDADSRPSLAADREAHGTSDSRSGEAAFECPRCGVVSITSPLPCRCAAAPALAAVPGRLVDKFVVERRLGAGGMGVVYLARDTALGRDVALKTLPHLAAGAVARLRDEAQAMATLNHDSLAVIYGLEEWRRTPVLIVEYLPNGTLAHRLTQGRLGPAETIALGIALARALVYMHARGVLHRDLKPSNIGFTAAGTPKLLDFGLAGLGHAVRAGTLAYLPPEAFEGASATATFDLWALTLVLREAVTAPVPPALNQFFDRTLDRDPARRPRTAADVLALLEALRSETT